MQCKVLELRDRPAKEEGREGCPIGIRNISSQRPARSPRAIAMSPPVVLAQCHRFAWNTQNPARPTGLIEARDILHDASVTLTKVVLLFVRIHPSDPVDIETDARWILSQYHAKTLESFYSVNR